MNKKLYLSLLLVAVGCEVNMCAGPLGKSMGTGLATFGLGVFGGMEAQYYRAIGLLSGPSQTIGDIAQSSCKIAALATVYSLPVYYGLNSAQELTGDKIYKDLADYRYNVLFDLAYDIPKLVDNAKIENFEDPSLKSLYSNLWKFNRLPELCRKESLDLSSSKQISFSTAPMTLSSLSFGSFLCGYPDIALALLAASYGSAGFGEFSKTKEDAKYTKIREILDDEVSPKQALHTTDEKFLIKMKAMIEEVATKNKLAQDDKHYNREKRHNIAREVFALHNK